VEDVYQVAGGDRFSGMGNPAWDNKDIAGDEMKDHPIDRELEFPTDDIHDLLVRMAVFWQGRVLLDLPVGDCHIVAVDETGMVSRNNLDGSDFVQINERHTDLLSF